jgi:hypothetical protein
MNEWRIIAAAWATVVLPWISQLILTGFDHASGERKDMVAETIRFSLAMNGLLCILAAISMPVLFFVTVFWAFYGLFA